MDRPSAFELDRIALLLVRAVARHHELDADSAQIAELTGELVAKAVRAHCDRPLGPRAGMLWTDDEEAVLEQGLRAGLSIKAIARTLDRDDRAVKRHAQLKGWLA